MTDQDEIAIMTSPAFDPEEAFKLGYPRDLSIKMIDDFF
jgi:hypothetical protein